MSLTLTNPLYPVTPDEMEKQLEENTRLTKDIHRVLLGQPEYKIPGFLADFEILKQLVHKHDRIIIKWGGGMVAAVAAFEVIKTFAGK